MTTVADEPRTAADKLRALTAAATPGPWVTDTSIPYGHRVGSSDDADWVAWTGEHGETGSAADAAYIAAMGPNVGALLSDWLGSWGDVDIDEHASMPDDLAHALRIARAVNAATHTT